MAAALTRGAVTATAAAERKTRGFVLLPWQVSNRLQRAPMQNRNGAVTLLGLSLEASGRMGQFKPGIPGHVKGGGPVRKLPYHVQNMFFIGLCPRRGDGASKLATASRIWNIDTAGRTGDWKRNAGASFLVTRKLVKLSYGVPRVIKTNVDLPCIIGGRQNIYFFPNVVLVIEGNRAGAVSYDQLVVLWSNTVFIEDDGVPSDTQTHLLQLADLAFCETLSRIGFACDFRVRKSKM